MLWSRTIKHQIEVVTLANSDIGSVTILYSVRARHIRISIRPNGEVRLTIPKGADKKVAMDFLESRLEWIKNAQRRLTQRGLSPLRKEFSKQEIEELRHRAKGFLPQRVAELASQYGFAYRALTIRATRSKWGSCTGENSISLSLFLMLLPPHLIDFVIIHELCHTVHHNHSPKFHQTVNNCTAGAEKSLEKELREFRV